MTTPSVVHTPPAEKYALNLIRATYDKKKYRFFSSKRYDLNIGGIRNPTTKPNRFDDSLFVAFIDERWTWRVALWSCTTDPGLFFLGDEKMGDTQGTAILIPGQYRGAWMIGKHKGKYPALVQNGMGVFKVWRDRDKDGVIDTSGKVYDDVTGLNCHKAHDWNKGAQVGKKKSVKNWSAGCQVSEVSSAHDYLLMPLARTQVKKGAGRTFTYTLFNASDFEGLKTG
jgi:hypothetical protein